MKFSLQIYRNFLHYHLCLHVHRLIYFYHLSGASQPHVQRGRIVKVRGLRSPPGYEAAPERPSVLRKLNRTKRKNTRAKLPKQAGDKPCTIDPLALSHKSNI